MTRQHAGAQISENHHSTNDNVLEVLVCLRNATMAGLILFAILLSLSSGHAFPKTTEQWFQHFFVALQDAIVSKALLSKG
mmetsp:Transcript_9203/g.19841  ORF Transcript_9203/g.19841 Transcript_9203/m.19841 type:complete len:80 (+) Transcript_9203:81-320(+)